MIQQSHFWHMCEGNEISLRKTVAPRLHHSTIYGSQVMETAVHHTQVHTLYVNLCAEWQLFHTVLALKFLSVHESQCFGLILFFYLGTMIFKAVDNQVWSIQGSTSKQLVSSMTQGSLDLLTPSLSKLFFKFTFYSLGNMLTLVLTLMILMYSFLTSTLVKCPLTRPLTNALIFLPVQLLIQFSPSIALSWL